MSGGAAAAGAALVPQFFARRSVLITGATGFMGKVLVERLLCTCPDVGALFLLVRAKRDALPEKRLKDLKECPVFDALRARSPAQLDKLRLVPGDLCRPGLALSSEDIASMQEVSVVFNVAATVKFQEPLRAAADQNVLSVTRVLELADQLDNLVALVHVSTAYANAEHEHVEERVYPAPRDLSALLREALETPDHASAREIERIISPKPNTYTYTKALGELVLQRHRARYATAIFRPTVVVSSLRHPVPGWVDSANGAAGALLAIGSGFMRVFPAHAAAKGDLLPVDMAIDTLIAVAWETAVDKLPTPRVYNCATGENPTTWAELRDAAETHARAQPSRATKLYPSCSLVRNRFLYQVQLFLTQTAPLHIAEYIRRLLTNNEKSKSDLIKVSNRLASMSSALGFFSCRQWRFDTHNTQRLCARLSPADANIYNLDPHSIHWEQFYSDFARGVRTHVLRERDAPPPAARLRLRRLHYAQRAVTFLVLLVALRRVLLSPAPRALLALVLRMVALLRTFAALPVALVAAVKA